MHASVMETPFLRAEGPSAGTLVVHVVVGGGCGSGSSVGVGNDASRATVMFR